MKNTFQRPLSLLALAALLVAGPRCLTAAEPAAANADKQSPLIQVLQSDAPKAEKAIVCKKLAIYGRKEAVPVLAPLLADPELASWARIALEANPDPSALAALREAMGKLNGRLAIGVINSLGVRRDALAISALAARMKDADVTVASAAAEALGRVGGNVAAQALSQALGTASDGVRPAVAEGAIVCAGLFLAEGKHAEAMRLYDAVRQAKVPKQRNLEAIRGAILSRQLAGIPLLLEQLRSADKGNFGMGLRTARELAGKEVTAALVAELKQAPVGRQVPLILALADRTDATVLPAVLQIAEKGAVKNRATALSLLDRWRDVACVPVLLNAAAESEPELVRAAKAALSRVEGDAIDRDIAARLTKSSGKVLQVIVEMVGRRRIEAAVPDVVKALANPDAGVRRAAFETLGILGGEKEAADMVARLRKATDARERDDIEQGLIRISGRKGAVCLPYVLPLTQEKDATLRRIALPVLAAIGGAKALNAVKQAVTDPDATIQDEAVNMLCSWPNTWPEDTGVAEPLLALIKSSPKASHQVQGMRGYVLFLQENTKLNNKEKLAKVTELLPLLKRPEDQRLAISLLGTLPPAGALEILMDFAQQPAIAEESCLAIVTITKNGPKELCRKALQLVLEKSKNAETKNKAEERLTRLK